MKFLDSVSVRRLQHRGAVFANRDMARASDLELALLAAHTYVEPVLTSLPTLLVAHGDLRLFHTVNMKSLGRAHNRQRFKCTHFTS